MTKVDTVSEIDRRFMAAAIRLSERHVGLTGTNPSVGTIIVRDNGNGPIIVGSGITAMGGRPHAETIAHFVQRAGRPDDELVALALAALAAADSPGSELTELWEEADPEEWREANDAVRSVLEEA